MEATSCAHVEHPRIEIEPENVLPCQLGDRLFGGAHLQPEKRLQLAVLQDAILSVNRWVGHPRGRGLFAEIHAWFASQDRSGPFAFATICDSLNLDPDYIRHGLERWREQLQATSNRKAPFRRATNGLRHRVVPQRLRYSLTTRHADY